MFALCKFEIQFTQTLHINFSVHILYHNYAILKRLGFKMQIRKYFSLTT